MDEVAMATPTMPVLAQRPTSEKVMVLHPE
jgi:hypothetical protein